MLIPKVVGFHVYFLILDHHSTAKPEVCESEEVKFEDVSEAYSVLTDPKKRRHYDTGEDLEGGIDWFRSVHGNIPYFNMC